MSSVRSPQLWRLPVEMALKVPEGASACPRRLPLPSSLLPQQAMVSSVRSPHACRLPSEMALKVPEGTSPRPG